MSNNQQLRLLYDVLPVDMGVRVLEINGADVTCGVTKHYRNVSFYNITTFTKKYLQFKKDWIANCEIVNLITDDDLMPEGDFDLIVIHGVLDSLPVKEEGGINKRDLVQVAYEKLKKGGMLAIAVSNKYDVKYLLSNYLNPLREKKVKSAEEKKTPRLSHKGYSHMLSSVGFKHVETYIAIPSYHDVRQLISYNLAPSFAYFNREYHKSICTSYFVKRVIKKAVLVCRIDRLIESSYIIWSRK